MASWDPCIDYGALDEAKIARIGLDAAQYAFDHDVAMGLTNGDSLCLRVGVVENRTFVEWGARNFGPDAKKYLENIDPATGKLATAVAYQCDSGLAYHMYGPDRIPAGPQRYTGGVYYIAHVMTQQKGWLSKEFAGAGSGVQGHLDQATVYTALTRMAAAWALQQQALYGKAA